MSDEKDDLSAGIVGIPLKKAPESEPDTIDLTGVRGPRTFKPLASTHVLVPMEMRERLKKLSERTGIPLNKLLNEAVDNLLLKYHVPPVNPEVDAALEKVAARIEQKDDPEKLP